MYRATSAAAAGSGWSWSGEQPNPAPATRSRQRAEERAPPRSGSRRSVRTLAALVLHVGLVLVVGVVVAGGTFVVGERLAAARARGGAAKEAEPVEREEPVEPVAEAAPIDEAPEEVPALAGVPEQVAWVTAAAHSLPELSRAWAVPEETLVRLNPRLATEASIAAPTCSRSASCSGS